MEFYNEADPTYPELALVFYWAGLVGKENVLTPRPANDYSHIPIPLTEIPEGRKSRIL
jgi:hypothetical protein